MRGHSALYLQRANADMHRTLSEEIKKKKVIFQSVEILRLHNNYYCLVN